MMKITSQIATLFRTIIIINEKMATDIEIMEWANRENEHSHVENIDTLIHRGNENAEDVHRNNGVQESIDISKVINSFNLVIDWSKSVKLPVEDLEEYAKKLSSKNFNEIRVLVKL